MESKLKVLLEYITKDGKCPFDDWIKSLKDIKARAVIRVRLNRIILGNLGDCKPVGEGVSELRVNFGPGYRIYFGQDGTTLIILLCAGSKKAKKKILTWPNCFGPIIAGEKMNKLTKNYKDDLIKDLKDPKEAAEYLNAALQDGNQEIFLMALRDVAAARGIKNISKQTSLNRENMYRMLSNEGNPNLSSLATILDYLGLKLAIEIKEIHPSHSV